MVEKDEDWPDITPNRLGHESPKITINLPPKDCGKTSSRGHVVEELEIASLNDAYRRLKEGGLVPVTSNFTPLGGISKKMIVDPGCPGSQPWNLVKAAVSSPRSNVRDGINSEAKSLPGPMLTSTLRDNPGRVVTVRKGRRRRKKTTAAKKIQFQDPKLFRVAARTEKKDGNRKEGGKVPKVVQTQVGCLLAKNSPC